MDLTQITTSAYFIPLWTLVVIALVQRRALAQRDRLHRLESRVQEALSAAGLVAKLYERTRQQRLTRRMATRTVGYGEVHRLYDSVRQQLNQLSRHHLVCMPIQSGLGLNPVNQDIARLELHHGRVIARAAS